MPNLAELARWRMSPGQGMDESMAYPQQQPYTPEASAGMMNTQPVVGDNPFSMPQAGGAQQQPVTGAWGAPAPLPMTGYQPTASAYPEVNVKQPPDMNVRQPPEVVAGLQNGGTDLRSFENPIRQGESDYNDKPMEQTIFGNNVPRPPAASQGPMQPGPMDERFNQPQVPMPGQAPQKKPWWMQVQY